MLSISPVNASLILAFDVILLLSNVIFWAFEDNIPVTSLEVALFISKLLFSIITFFELFSWLSFGKYNINVFVFPLSIKLTFSNFILLFFILRLFAFLECNKLIVAFTSIVFPSNLIFLACLLEFDPNVKHIVLGSVLFGIVKVLFKIFTFSILPINTAKISSWHFL